jgi:hypothetical protein
MSEPEEKLLSTGECAARHGVSRQSITKAIGRGEIAARLAGGRHVIKESDCLNWQRVSASERGKKGAARRWQAEEEKP